MDKMAIKIERFEENPLLVPNMAIKWMGLNVFNCGVIKDEDGIWRMLVRGAHAEGQSHSDLGLALSTDGIHWNLLQKPVLESGCNEFCTLGVEDPRIVKWIDGYCYIFATANSEESGGRIGIWKTKNFFNYDWVGIPFGREDKNASIFPEPINGYAYLLHRRVPDIWISRTRDMTFQGGWENTQMLVHKDQFYPHIDHNVAPEKIGIAGPPVRTPKGWLIITHVVHRYDPKIPSKYSFLLYRSYSLSFMVLDLDDPRKVLYIHPTSILHPEKRHEVTGTVPNVVFSCATVDPGKDADALFIYWGGADTVICGGKLYKKDLPMCYEK